METDVTSHNSVEPLPILKPAFARAKSSQRMKYEAEVRFFRSTYGGLEDVRVRLGLSQRKICQLLLVDPSAWTRWGKSEEKVPPHIYRALEWYISLAEKDPGRSLVGGLQKQWRTELDVANSRLATLTQEIHRQKGVTGALAMLVVGAFMALGYIALFWR